MAGQLIRVPGLLLLHPDLAPSSKLVWIASRLSPVPGHGWSPAARLCQATGLSRPTVLKAIAELEAAGWSVAATTPSEPHVVIPAELLGDSRLGTVARLLYGLVQLLPGYQFQVGRLTHEELATLSNTNAKTVVRALDELVKAEWIILERAHRLAQIHFQFTFPGCEQALNEVAEAQWHLERARIGEGEAATRDRNLRLVGVGEMLMREYLSLLIDSVTYVDNAFPSFLRSPLTDELLELDRYYPPAVGFEFNGPQHYRPTKKYTLAQVRKQRARDYIKAGMCQEQGVTIVVIQAKDLTLQRMREKVGTLLPTRNLTGHELLIEFLETESQAYRRCVGGL